ncbi:MAG TPA: hypothetical protein RMI29_13300 [Polyangiaceae bacterium LLY-WYZ-15_(1-7)]|nr:hypothetical protein [Polyangiaceae bacterium LLY-WYZ-15_(1-7)]
MLVADDPLGGAERGASEAFTVAAAPQGHLWVEGPESESRAWLSVRDGEIEWRRDGVNVLGEHAVAPDGSLYQRGVTLVGDGEGVDAPGDIARRLIRVGPPPTYEVDSFVLPTEGHPRAPVVVGPNGVVYTMGSRSHVYATCRGERLMWELALRSAPGLRAGWESLTVAANGDLQARANSYDPRAERYRAARLHRFDSDGRLVSRWPDTPERAAEVQVRGPFLGGDVLVREEQGASTRFGVRSESGGDTAWWASLPSDRLPTGDSGWLRGVGDTLWLSTREALLFYPAPNESRTHSTERGVFLAKATDAPGELLFIDGRVFRTNEHGEELWSIRDEMHESAILLFDGESSAVLDYDGVLYVASGAILWAIQTDALPPERGTCLTIGCNPRQNGWMGSP